MEKEPRVLVSYSWDNNDHNEWVEKFAKRLRLNGVNAILDKWHVQPGESLTAFMEREVLLCDFVLIICTPNYYQKSINREGGVGYEQQIITGEILKGLNKKKFIPILKSQESVGVKSNAIPTSLSGILYLDMTTEHNENINNEKLLKTLFGKLEEDIPPIGNIPEFKLTNDFNEELRLSSLDLEGWQLVSGLAQHHRTPETFYVPNETDRRNLKVDNVVKLIFEIDVSDKEYETFVERMWVIIINKIGPYYLGKLDNVPCTSDEQDYLCYGDEVLFLPEHVIDIT